MDEKIKKKLESEILNDFYAEFEKATSIDEFQDLDKEYREVKKAGRRKVKKSKIM